MTKLLQGHKIPKEHHERILATAKELVKRPPYSEMSIRRLYKAAVHAATGISVSGSYVPSWFFSQIDKKYEPPPRSEVTVADIRRLEAVIDQKLDKTPQSPLSTLAYNFAQNLEDRFAQIEEALKDIQQKLSTQPPQPAESYGPNLPGHVENALVIREAIEQKPKRRYLAVVGLMPRQEKQLAKRLNGKYNLKFIPRSRTRLTTINYDVVDQVYIVKHFVFHKDIDQVTSAVGREKVTILQSRGITTLAKEIQTKEETHGEAN